MGLFLLHRAVSASGGTVEVESEEGKGTTFIVRLRCLQGAHPVLSEDYFAVETSMGQEILDRERMERPEDSSPA